MKIKATVTINTGLYMDIRPEIEIDTENYDDAVQLIRDLHKNFYKLLEPNSANAQKKVNKVKDEYLAETSIQAEAELDQENVM